MNRDISGCGVEVFALDAADLAAVNSIGKIGVEARKIEVIRTAAYLLIGSEADAQRTVADVFVRVDFGAQGDYLGNAGFVVRAEQSGMIGNYKLAPDIFIADHRGVRAVKFDYMRLDVRAADIGRSIHMRDKPYLRAIFAAIGRRDMPINIAHFVAHCIGDSRAAKLLDEIIGKDELGRSRGHGIARLVGSGFKCHIFQKSFGNGHFYHLRFFVGSMIAQSAEFGNRAVKIGGMLVCFVVQKSNCKADVILYRLRRQRTAARAVPTVLKLNIREGYVPLMRNRCVEVAAPYKLHAFCRQTISALLHRIHIVTPNTEKLIPKNRQSENCPCHLRDTGSVQLCFELWIMT